MKSWIDYNTKCKLVGWCNCTLCPGVLPLFDSTAIAFDMLVVDVVQAVPVSDNYWHCRETCGIAVLWTIWFNSEKQESNASSIGL